MSFGAEEQTIVRDTQRKIEAGATLVDAFQPRENRVATKIPKGTPTAVITFDPASRQFSVAGMNTGGRGRDEEVRQLALFLEAAKQSITESDKHGRSPLIIPASFKPMKADS